MYGGLRSASCIERYGESIATAIQREKRIKKHPRQWKINLIEEMNPHWFDLYNSFNV